MMRTEKFGETITYYHNKALKNNLFDFIKKNGFKDYSPGGITSFLTFRYPIGDITMFEGYKKIPFGQYRENERNQTFWYPKFGGCNDSLDKAIKKIEKLLLDSIKKLTWGLDKIAISLSGGIDSSLIVAMTRKIYPRKKIFTYSAGFYGDDEFEYARSIAQKNSTIHKEKVFYKKDFLGEDSILSNLIKFKAEPLHPNELPLAVIEKMAKNDEMDIVLCGEGSDDIFGGYGQNCRMYMNYDFKESFFKFFLDHYRYFSIEDRNIIKDKYIVDDLELLMKYIKFCEIGQDFRNWAFYFIQKFHTPGLIIRGANVMRFNEFPIGFPYIDDELVNYTNSLPFEFKVHWKSKKHKEDSKNMYFRDISEKMDVPKYILKKVAEKYLPFEIIYRLKKGFPVPFEHWFKDLNEWDFDKTVFKNNDISKYSGWKKFMLINLDTFIKNFNKYKKET